MKKWRYNNLFIYSSFQFSGNIEEYFASHSRKLIVFIILPRLKNKENFIRIYKKGKLINEKKVFLSSNVFMYYILWFVNYIRCILMFEKKEKIIVLGMHPITFFGMSFQKMLRNITFVYWICDYFPGDTFIIKAYERLKKHYHDVIPFSIYLSDELNRLFNGKIIKSDIKRTIMWGVKAKKSFKKSKQVKGIRILFVGIIKEQQGLESIFKYLKKDSDSSISVLGVCEQKLYNKYKRLIKNSNIKNQVYFPNKNFYGKKLEEFADKSDVGIALYDMGKQNLTYYADPAKIKTYTEFGLPVIMTDISSVARYIKKYNAGIVIKKRDENSINTALIKIKENYGSYRKGVDKFNKHFYFESYYKKSFSFIENL